MEIRAIHESTDQEKLLSLAKSMIKDGWVGRPVLVIDCAEYYLALTGSHRIAAAKIAEIDVEIMIIDQPLFDDSDVSILFSELADADDDDQRLAILTRLHSLGAVEDAAAKVMEAELEQNEKR